MNSPTRLRPISSVSAAAVGADQPPVSEAVPPGLPSGPLTSAELAAAVSCPGDRGHYRRVWHGMYRRADQVDDLRLRSLALARTWPDGVLRGRSAALLWGDDSIPVDALPEIWLPATRRSRPGRVYRYGALPTAAVTELDGLRVTTALRTCRDLASDLGPDDAVVALERLCAAVPGLAEQLRAAAEHPSGRGARRFTEVVAAMDPRSGSAEATRARLELTAAGFGGFSAGHLARIDGRTIALPLADPVTRRVVITGGGPAGPVGGSGPAAERYRTMLRSAGWTVIVVRGHEAPAAADRRGAADRRDTAVRRDTDGHRDTGADEFSTLVSRWPDSELLPPLPAEAAADPHGMWAGRGRPDGQSSVEGAWVSAGERV